METERLAPGKKNAARLGAHLVFVDESGFLLIPTVRRTWAPRGQTPIIRHRYRRDKISVISGVSVSPRRRRMGLYWRFHAKNIQHAEVCDFLRYLLRHLRGPVIVVWDNGKIHRGDPIRALCRRVPRLRLEHFPSYAPELNPDEGVWNLAKARLANGRPDNVEDLRRSLADSLRTIAHSPSRLRGCIRHAGLPFF
jgi:transposase